MTRTVLYRLTWDTLTYGSFLASVIPQIFASLFLMVFSIYNVVTEFYWGSCCWAPSEVFMALDLIMLIIICTTILTFHINLWASGPRGAFKRGIKDPRDKLDKRGGLSIFGWRRPSGEQNQLLIAVIWTRRGVFKLVSKTLPTWLTNVIFRRIMYVVDPSGTDDLRV
jgi:hypothetical protein